MAWILLRFQSACRFKIELWSSLTLTAWGIWQGLHPNLFLNANYAVTTRILTETQWVAVVCTIGCLQLLSVAWDWRSARIGCAGVAAWAWGALGISFLMANTGAPGWIPYVGWALANAHSMARDVRKRPVSL